MGVVFTNNGSTTITNNITNVQTTIEVDATASFPTVGGGDYFWATLIAQDGTREVVKVTSLAGSTYTVTRAQDDTSGSAFTAADRFQLRFPKVVLEDFRDDIDVNTTDLAGSTNAGTVPAPSGTNMFFYQAAAPTNWTIYTTVEDCLLAVKGGAQAYNIAGGTGAEAGSWTPSTHVHTMGTHTHGYAHTHGQAAHIHTMPTHVHTMGTHTHSGPSHTHTGPSHNHQVFNHIDNNTAGQVYDSGGNAVTLSWDHEQGNVPTISVQNADARADSIDWYSTNAGTGATGAGGTGNTGATDPGDTNATDPGDTNSTDAGSTNSQSTSTTDATDPGDTNAGSPVSTDRPLAAVGILATKD
jgi:hypothetical protein